MLRLRPLDDAGREAHHGSRAQHKTGGVAAKATDAAASVPEAHPGRGLNGDPFHATRPMRLTTLRSLLALPWRSSDFCATTDRRGTNNETPAGVRSHVALSGTDLSWK